MLSENILGVAITGARPTIYRQLMFGTDLDTLGFTATLDRGALPSSGAVPATDLYVLNNGWEGATSPFSEVVSARVSGGEGAGANSKQGQERRITMPIAWKTEAARHDLNEVLQHRHLQVVFRRTLGSDTDDDRKLIMADELTEQQIAEAVFDHEEAMGALLLRSDFPWLVNTGSESTTLTSTAKNVVLPSHSEGPCLYGFRFETPTKNTVTLTLKDTKYNLTAKERGEEWVWTWNTDTTDTNFTQAEYMFFCPAPSIGGFEFFDTATTSGTIDGNPVRDSYSGKMPSYLKNYRSYTAKVDGAPCDLFVWSSWRAV